MSALETDGLRRLADRMHRHTDDLGVPGAAWLVACGDQVEVGTAGVLDLDTGQPVPRDGIFRIASMTKPVVALAALMLCEEGLLRLDEPVDRLLPELADRQVLAGDRTSLAVTEPARRPITLRDVLTFRLGLGADFANWGRQPTMAAMDELGLGIGPPSPAVVPEPDEWMRRLGTLPLEHHPGERWLYHTGAEVLGVLVARAAGAPLADALRDLVLEPLGMTSTGFVVDAADRHRFGPSYGPPGEDGRPMVFDATDGGWAAAPAFASGGGGLVSTVDDFAAFATMLRQGGRHAGGRLLGAAAVAAMTTNQLTERQLADSPPSPDGDLGWGFGVGVQLRRTGLGRAPGAYGWDGGLGTSWANDPSADLTGILLVNQLFTSPRLPAIHEDFWTLLYAALE